MSLASLLAESKKQEDQDKSGNSLFCCILGPSGAGKSHSIGTTKLKTLQLYFAGEKHGIKSASKEGGDNIVPFCVDFSDGKQLDADETLARIRAVIQDPDGLVAAGFEVIALDGLSELDLCIAQSRELKKQCLTPQGKVDHFKVPAVTKIIGNGLIKDLISLQRKTGLHVLSTCIIDVKVYGENNEVQECAPRLSTFGFAESLLQMFPDRVVCGPILKEDGERVYAFDSMTQIIRSSKDENGRVKKTFNFTPRLGAGVMPKIMRADLAKLIEIKDTT